MQINLKKIIYNHEINNLLNLMTQFDSKLIAQARKTKGYLQKKSSSTFSTWKLKYFLFLDDSLCAFKDQTLQYAQTSLHFSDILHVHPLDTLIIQIKTAKKTYFLKAEIPADQDLWIASINILKENHSEKGKSPKKSWSSSHSLEKPVSSSFKSLESAQKTKTQKSSGIVFSTQKITYLLRGKELNKFLNLLHLEKLSMMAKEERFLCRILFIEDKRNGIFFSLASKSIYPTIDSELVKEDLIYPYQLNVLYILPISSYKSALEGKTKSIKLIEVCKCSEILESVVINSSLIRLQIHCQKPVQIQVKHLPEIFISNLQQCIKKLIDVGKQYWNPKGKLLKNIDEFVHKFIENQSNQLVFYKMVENQFNSALKVNTKTGIQKKQIEIYFIQFDNVVSNLKNFIDACEIKVNPVDQIKSKFVKLYHKFVYNFLNQNWNLVYKLSSDEDLIIYSKKVFSYYQALNPIHHDSRVKEGCRTLLKIALKNFSNSINQLINNFTNIEEESLRILKKIEFEKEKEMVGDFIFFSTYCTNFLSILSTQFRYLTEIPKFDEFVRMAWISMQQISKFAFEKLSQIAQLCKQRSSLISITNSLKLLKNKRIPELFNQLEKTFIFTYKKEKEDFLKEINYEIGLVETFCVKKLFVITFSSIDKDLLKLDIKNMDFHKICTIVIDQISKLEHILPEVRVAMYDAAFEQVCYFFYICIVKFDNKLLTKDECLSMVNQKMTSIKDSFMAKVDQQKIINLLKDLNLLKQFITCPINNIKMVTKELKKVFGSNFTELNLKNLISLRVSTLKEKQYIFEECRQEIKSSYNSTDEIQSFQRQSFFNGSIRRQRVSTLTGSLMSYCEQFEKVQHKTKRQRTILFGVQNSLHEGPMCRKKIIKNFDTNYKLFFYRLKKGKLFEYDNESSQDILNCHLLSQLKKCFIEPQKKQCMHLEFEKETIKLRCAHPEDSSQWIQKILQAMEGTKSLISDLNEAETDEDGVLFEDLSKKITLETKETHDPSSPKEKQKVRYVKKQSEEAKIGKTPPKNTSILSPKVNKKEASPSKQKVHHDSSKQKGKKIEKSKAKKEKGGCGAGCNLF